MADADSKIQELLDWKLQHESENDKVDAAMSQRVRNLEDHRSSHSARVDLKWKTRDDQDKYDQKRFRTIETSLGDVDKRVDMLALRVGIYASIGAVVGGAGFQLFQLLTRPVSAAAGG